jgi:hypothetical protein
MVSEHAAPKAPKSADNIEGAMTAGGDMAANPAEALDEARSTPHSAIRPHGICDMSIDGRSIKE